MSPTINLEMKQHLPQARLSAGLGLVLVLTCLISSEARISIHHGRAEYAPKPLPARLSVFKALPPRFTLQSTANNRTKPPAETGIGNVLVMGSTGLIGSAVTAVLTQAGYTVHQVRHRYDVDLRLPGTLQRRFNNTPIDFAFFLACEFGGSKYLHAPGVQERIWDHNMAMYDSVLPFLEKRTIPFLFASSMHSVLNSTYGRMKLEGEKRVLAGGVGKVAKFWNVYGYEKVGLRSHVLTDWLHACASGRPIIHSLTDGHERKQFVHADDMGRALVDLMAGFKGLAPVTDLTTGAWMSMRQVAGMVARAAGGSCHVLFSRKRAPVTVEPEPANLWRVGKDMDASMRHMLARYEADAAKDTQWRTRDEVYLSIIVASTNDDYNGIRARMFASTHHLSAVAEEVGLDYELIVVQYNPRINTDYFGKPYNASTDDELPLSQLLPLTGKSARARLRIVTVPPNLHRHADKGRLWEFNAKNAGVRRARGRFVLLTNMDDIFPRELLSWIAKGNMQADTVLMSHTILNFAPDQASDMQGACDVAASMTAPSPNPVNSCNSVMLSASTAVGAIARSGWASRGIPYDMKSCFMGDFSLWNREAFIRTGGYVETYQNLHVESAHRMYIQQWAGSPIKYWQFADQPTCHQAHERRGRPATLFNAHDLVQQHKSRTDNATWGFVQQALPIATTASVLDRGYNPLTPFALYRHHPVFDGFHFSQAPFDADYLVDFVGTKTRYKYDCADWDRYRRFHLSRRIPCERHDAFKAMGVGLSGIPLLGDLPIMDEEYLEWVSLLQAVNAYVARSDTLSPRPFVVAEFGARYGSWAARGARAVRSKIPDARVDVCVVEGDPTSYKWMIAHLERNVPPSPDHFVLHGIVANTSWDNVPAISWKLKQVANISKKQAISTVSVGDAMAKYDTVDIVHMDIQTEETVCLEADTMAALKAKVKALHIGTHTTDSHQRLRAGFLAAGWSVTHDILPNSGAPPGRIEQTDFGPVNFYWHGELRAINAGLVGV